MESIIDWAISGALGGVLFIVSVLVLETRPMITVKSVDQHESVE